MMLNVSRQIVSVANHFTANGVNTCLGASTQLRYKSKIYVKRPPPIQEIRYEAMAQTLKAKGYLRPQDPYDPPKNVPQIVDKLKVDTNIRTGFSGTSFTAEDKFNFLTSCSKEFNHTVPNSVLHEINTINDVVEFYQTSVNTYLPLDELTTRKLPPNLHIEHNYTRFHPDTDTMFGGKTAFPESSTIITGLKYRKQYAGFEAKKKVDYE